MADGIYFDDQLDNILSGIEVATARYDGEFREGALFALDLVRLSLGLGTSLTIPIRKNVCQKPILAEWKDGEATAV